MCLLVILLDVAAINLKQLMEGTRVGHKDVYSVSGFMYHLLIGGVFVDNLGRIVNTIAVAASCMW